MPGWHVVSRRWQDHIQDVCRAFADVCRAPFFGQAPCCEVTPVAVIPSQNDHKQAAQIGMVRSPNLAVQLLVVNVPVPCLRRLATGAMRSFCTMLYHLLRGGSGSCRRDGSGTFTGAAVHASSCRDHVLSVTDTEGTKAPLGQRASRLNAICVLRMARCRKRHAEKHCSARVSAANATQHVA